MRVRIRHVTRLEYDAEVVEGVMDLRLGPLTDADQRWERFTLTAEPNGRSRGYLDSFGNRAQLVTFARPHRAVEIVTDSEVETLLADPFSLPPTPPRPLDPADRADFLATSALIQLSTELRQTAEPFRPSTPNQTFDSVSRLMGLIHATFAYRKDVTTVATTAPEALAASAGVCQDFAHVLIALCRAIDIPARYVSGYIVSQREVVDPSAARSQVQRLGNMVQSQSFGAVGGRQSQSYGAVSPPASDPAADQIPNRGAGASHAWVEAYTPTHGWRGFDPTNNLVASRHHVKMAIGRDYGDVPPSRGTYRGLATERLTVDVTTTRLA